LKVQAILIAKSFLAFYCSCAIVQLLRLSASHPVYMTTLHGFIMWMNAMKSTSMGCLHPYYLLRLVPFRQESQLCARNMNTSVQSCQILSHGALRYRSCRTRLSCNIFQPCRSHLIVLPIDAPFKKEAREVKSSHSERLATQNRCRGLARQAPLRFISSWTVRTPATHETYVY